MPDDTPKPAGGAPETGGAPLSGGAPGGGGDVKKTIQGLGEVPVTGGAPEGGGVPLSGGAPGGGGDVRQTSQGLAEVPITGGAPETGGAPTGVPTATVTKSVGESQSGYRVAASGQGASATISPPVAGVYIGVGSSAAGVGSMTPLEATHPNSTLVLLMRQIALVTKGPSGIVKKFNEVISSFNALNFIKGSGINLTPTDRGWIISTVAPVSKQSDPPPLGTTSTTSGGGAGGSTLDLTAPNGVTASWQKINVIDNSTGTCVTKSIYYWGTPAV